MSALVQAALTEIRLVDRRTDRLTRGYVRPPSGRRKPWATLPSPSPKAGSLAKTFKIFLPFAGLTVKVPVGLYLSCKLLLFQSLLLMSPDDGGFYATIVAVARLHAVRVHRVEGGDA